MNIPYTLYYDDVGMMHFVIYCDTSIYQPLIIQLGLMQALKSPFTPSSCQTPTPHFFLTLLNEGAVHEPHGIVECSRGHGSHREPRWVEPVEQVH